MHNIEIYWDKKLGQGGEGEVYKGRLEGREVAVKVPHNHQLVVQVPLLRAEARRGLEEEYQRRNIVQGEHHVKMLGHGLDHVFPFLVLELAEMGSLADEMEEMKRRGQIYEPLAALARIEEILCALQEAHNSNIIHRDVKPANFLKFADGRIKLNDFGLGRTADRACSNQTKFFRGTPQYAAPEQLNGQCVTKRADLYAVGVILHEMLFGTRPNASSRVLTLPSRPDVRPELRAFLESLLAHDPDRRYCCAPRSLRELQEVRSAYQAVARPCPRCGQYHHRN